MSQSPGAPRHEACNSGPPHPARKIECERLCEIRGVPFLSSMCEIFDKVEKFQAKADDILIATYPKAGTTWMIEIVDSIRQGGITKEIKTIPSHERAPYLEMNSQEMIPAGLDLLEAMPSPRLVKTHLPFQLVPQSFWDKGCKDPTREVERLAHFLGHTLDEGMIQEIVKHTSFNMMKDNPMTNASILPTSILDLSISPFMRKGQVGDWKNYFTVAQDERFEEEYRRRMAGTSLRFRTEL
ncbi:ST1A1 Sulfotransferase, partial [Polypterus senegalus]